VHRRRRRSCNSRVVSGARSICWRHFLPGRDRADATSFAGNRGEPGNRCSTFASIRHLPAETGPAAAAAAAAAVAAAVVVAAAAGLGTGDAAARAARSPGVSPAPNPCCWPIVVENVKAVARGCRQD